MEGLPGKRAWRKWNHATYLSRFYLKWCKHTEAWAQTVPICANGFVGLVSATQDLINSLGRGNDLWFSRSFSVLAHGILCSGCIHAEKLRHTARLRCMIHRQCDYLCIYKFTECNDGWCWNVPRLSFYRRRWPEKESKTHAHSAQPPLPRNTHTRVQMPGNFAEVLSWFVNYPLVAML